MDSKNQIQRREIKFRAWDKERREMLDYFEIGCRGMIICDEENEPQNIELMQFTGLLDKNGKEIYEGDIMQHTDPFDIPFIINWNDEQAAFVFNDDGCGYSLNDKSFSVIGNIFENPELLNEKK